MAKELAWLEQKTHTYENPAEKRLEELRRICILNKINNPIIGEELYDPKKPDCTKMKQQFRDWIRKQADDQDIYLKFKKDRRQTMGECLMKGEDYEKAKKEKQDMFLLTMKYHVWGIESLTKKEIRILKKEGVIKVRKSRFSREVDEDDEAESQTGSKKQLKKDGSAKDTLSASGSAYL